MSVYKIKFTNKGYDSLDYTVWSALPTVVPAGVGQIWANAFMSRTVPKGGLWNVAFNSAPWAYCGTSPGTGLAPGTIPDVTMVRQATLGVQGAGSTHHIYNSDGSPAFQDHDTYTANVGAFEIQTTNDFTPNLNWVAGYALSDSNGQTRPVATFSIQDASTYMISPPPAPKFRLSAFKALPGTLIDNDMIHVSGYAEIDFAQHPGQNNAIVTIDESGLYHVEFVTQPIFAMMAAGPAYETQNPTAQLTQLKHHVKVLSDLIDTAMGVSESPTFNTNLWRCSFKWTQDVPDISKVAIARSLGNSMSGRGYKLKSQSVKPDLKMDFSHPRKDIMPVVLHDWISSWNDLPPIAKPLLAYPKVERLFSIQDDPSSAGPLDVPDVDLPVLRPDYECSIDWLEGPNEETKQTIHDILESHMRRLEYYTFEPIIDDKSLKLPVWHLDHPSVETVLAAWNSAVTRLAKVMLRNYVTNVRVEGLYHKQEDKTTALNQLTNGQAEPEIFPPLPPAYACYLTWLEGAPPQTRTMISNKLREFMASKEYVFMNEDLGGEKLQMQFFHLDPSTEAQAKIDWDDAYHSLGTEAMFVTDPRVEPLIGPADTVGSSSTVFPPRPPTYACYLDWLEGPTSKTKAYILYSLADKMAKKGYRLENANIGGPKLRATLSHPKPSDLKTATEDWINAWRGLGFLGMYVTNPVVEPVFFPADNATDSASTFPPLEPTYVGSFTWLEGPTPSVKASIIAKLITYMSSKGYKLYSSSERGDDFSIWFSHSPLSDLETARNDWLAARDTLGFQRMYASNFRVEDAPVIATGGESSTSSLPVMPPTYVAFVTWLEGANKQTRLSITKQLVLNMLGNKYTPLSINDNKTTLKVFFSHDFPQDLPAATATWVAAVKALGFQAMYAGNPRVENAIVIQAGNISVDDLKLDDTAAPISSANGTNGATNAVDITKEEAQPVHVKRELSNMAADETLAEKKKRALALLEAQGLGAFAAAIEP